MARKTWRATAFGATILLGMLYIAFVSRSEAADAFYIADEISVDGPALFYGVEADRRVELWSVHCAQPLRSCVARAPRLVLRVDHADQPWLITVVRPGVRISIQERNFTRDAPFLLSRPLDPDVIRQLSGEKSFLVLEEQGVAPVRTRTTGLEIVIDYLRWVRGQTAHTLRDARLWPRRGPIRIDDMPDDVLERYEIMQRRAHEAQRQLVPETKPQVEFAIGAQDGTSYFSSTGRPGY